MHNGILSGGSAVMVAMNGERQPGSYRDRRAGAVAASLAVTDDRQ